MKKMQKCEVRPADDRPCSHNATFVVGTGGRKIDRQASCSRHLAATTIAVIGSQDVMASITWYPNGMEKGKW